MAVTPEREPRDGDGEGAGRVELFPSCPKLLGPSTGRRSQWSARRCGFRPRAMAVTADASPMTVTGTELLLKALFPSWPLMPAPQHWTPPEVVTAQVWVSPPVTEEIPVESPMTPTGVKLPVVELLPS